MDQDYPDLLGEVQVDENDLSRKKFKSDLLTGQNQTVISGGLDLSPVKGQSASSSIKPASAVEQFIDFETDVNIKRLKKKAKQSQKRR